MIDIINPDMTVLQLLRRLALPAAGLVLLSIPSAFAQEHAPAGDITSQDEIKQFCTTSPSPPATSVTSCRSRNWKSFAPTLTPAWRKWTSARPSTRTG